MGDEESETGVVDIESQPEQGRGVKRGGVSCEERCVWRGKVNEKEARWRSGEWGNEC